MKRFISSICLILVTSTAFADSASELDAVQFFHDYVADYNDYLADPSNPKAIDSVTQHFHMPLLQFPKAGATALNSREQLGKNLKFFLDSLKTKGIGRITWQTLQVHQLDDTTIIANNIANAMTIDGKVAKQMAAFYILNKSDGAWRIASLKQHDIDKLLNIN